MVNTYEDGGFEWRIDGGRGEVGGDRDSSCTVAPAALCVSCERSEVVM